jgi:hypothetical protein
MARFTTRELESLAAYAHDAGYTDYLNTPEETEPDYTRADLERLALEKLAASALFAPHAEDTDARAVWSENYYRGWRFGESDSYGYEQPTIELEGIGESEGAPDGSQD